MPHPPCIEEYPINRKCASCLLTDANRRELIMQRWHVVQHELLPELLPELGTLTPKLEKLIHTLEWVRIEEFGSFEKRVGHAAC
jgi:hypothetical protein